MQGVCVQSDTSQVQAEIPIKIYDSSDIHPKSTAKGDRVEERNVCAKRREQGCLNPLGDFIFQRNRELFLW